MGFFWKSNFCHGNHVHSSDSRIFFTLRNFNFWFSLDDRRKITLSNAVKRENQQINGAKIKNGSFWKSNFCHGNHVHLSDSRIFFTLRDFNFWFSLNDRGKITLFNAVKRENPQINGTKIKNGVFLKVEFLPWKPCPLFW